MTEVTRAIAEGFKLLRGWIEGSDRRQWKACKESAEKYIQVNEKEGEFKEITDKRKKQLLKHYKKRFFRFN